MSRYVYIASGLDAAQWTRDGKFFGGLGTKPTDFITNSSLKAAKEVQMASLVKHGYACVIHKFEAKPPYKFVETIK